MMSKKSIYQCPVCGAEVQGRPAKRMVCGKCKVQMEEVFQGVVTKGGKWKN